MLPGKQFTPEEILRIVWRRKWWVFTPFVLATIATVAGLRYVPDLYRSETLILVVAQRVPDIYVRSTVASRIEDRLQSMNQQILSRTRLEPIITEFNLYPVERARLPMEEIINRMRLEIKAEPIRGDAFRVSYVARDPVIAQKVTERLASLFIEENLRDREVLADATNQFLESQLEEARNRLVQHEKRLEAYRLRYSGELPNQAQSNMQAVQTLQSQVQGLTDSVARDRDRRLILERQLAELQRENLATVGGSSATPRDSAELDQLPEGSAQRQLAAARTALEALKTRLKAEHPDIIRAKGIIADLEVKARAEQEAIAAAAKEAAETAATGASAAPAPANPADRRVAELRAELTTVTREIDTKEAQLARVQQEMDGYRARLAAIPTRESEMTELMRDYDTLRSVYTDLLGKRESSKVAVNLERRQLNEQFRVLDPARRPEVPFSPNRQYYTLAGAFAGLALGLALVALLEFRDNTFHREDDVTHALGMPVLAIVPMMMNTAERRRRRLRALATSGVALVGAVGVAAFVVYRVWT